MTSTLQPHERRFDYTEKIQQPLPKTDKVAVSILVELAGLNLI
jgi:hypothetical protein